MQVCCRAGARTGTAKVEGNAVQSANGTRHPSGVARQQSNQARMVM